jgi:hypothetical protein
MALCFGGQDLQPRPDLLLYLNNLVYCVKGLKRYPRSAGEQVANLLRQKKVKTLPPLRGEAGCKPAPAKL